MVAKILKKLNESLPDPIKRLVAPQIRNRLINNRIFLDQYHLLIQKEKMSSEEQKKLHYPLLQEQLVYAFENIPMYRELFSASGYNVYSDFDEQSFQKIPILSKADIKKNFDRYISLKELDCYPAQTGGTTGEPLKLYLDSDSIYKEKAYIYHHWSKLGYDYNTSRLITFRGIDVKNKFYKYNPLYNEIIVSPFYLNNKNIMKYVKLINDYRPDFLHGYPSAIKNFCRILCEEKIQLTAPIKGVFFISEEVTQKDRGFIEMVLGCKTLAFYGHSERAVFAEETEAGCYEFHPLYGHTEFLPTGVENEYEIVATGFLNKKMPLIRYDTGDIASFDKEGIKIIGRSDKQHLVGSSGEKISLASKVFHDGTFGAFAKYQFLQNKPGYVEMNILDKNISKEKSRVEKFLEEKFDGVIEFKIQQTEALQLSSRGKEKILIQNIKEL